MNKVNKREFSKTLLIQESALMWVHTLFHFILAFYCIYQGYTGSLPWLAASASFPWAAYGISQAYYYKKSLAENTKNGIKYDSVITELNQSILKHTKTLNGPSIISSNYDDYNAICFNETDRYEEEQIENADNFQI